MNYTYVLLSILIMALVTYLPRMLPLVLFRKTIENQFIKSFWHMCLCGTWCYDISSILFSTSPDGGFSLVYFLGGWVGMLAAMVLAYFNRGLLLVAVSSVVVAFITQELLGFIM
ncbi:MAG: AzlD domain-containing protein [Acutalibacteraceae bacterium]